MEGAMTNARLERFYKDLRKRNEEDWGNRRFEIAHHLGRQSHADFFERNATLSTLLVDTA